MKNFIAMENLEVPTVVDKFIEYIWKEERYPRTILKTIFPAFHPWLLQAYEDDALPGQPRPGDAAPPEVHLTNNSITEYVVSQVLDSRIRRNLVDPHTGERGLLQYKVEWVSNDQSKP
ncbi:hypothetical protein P3342_004536 [Pyrenophora teres f. teres]|nr:hypothetical protein P3342_004536 [Pyrenophora teres f. teres]